MSDDSRRTALLAAALAVALAVGAGPGYATTAGAAGGPADAAQPGPLPPGVNESGVADPVRLADAHADVLGDATYAVEASQVERFANGSLRTRVNTTGAVAPDGEFRYATSVEAAADRYYAGPVGDWEVWSNGTATVAAFTNDSGTAYQLRGRTDPSLDRRETLAVLLGTLETAVTDSRRANGTTVYRLTATGVDFPADLAAAYGVDEAWNVSFRANVTAAGLVRDYRVAFDAARGTATTRVVETVRFGDVGEATVERPDWVSRALERTGGR